MSEPWRANTTSAREVTTINGRRCTGHCCKRFFLPFSPEELAAEASAAERGEGTYNVAEIRQVASMVIHLGKSDRDINGGKRVAPGHYYTCMWHDTVSGNCLIYGHRPRMCSEYPYGQPCGYDACACGPWFRRVFCVRPLWRAATALLRCWSRIAIWSRLKKAENPS